MGISAVLLARGGSKRIPRKNIQPFRGRPLLGWPLAAAREWGRFERIIISTDCAQIETSAVALGAETLGLRDAGTATDTATTTEALQEVLGRLQVMGHEPEWLCCLYGSAAFVTSSLLEDAYAKLQAGWDTVFPVIRFSHPIWRALRRDDDGTTGFIWPENAATRTQDLPVSYHDAGQFYMFRTSVLKHTGSILGGRTATIELPEHACHDIDSLTDLAVAEIKHAAMPAFTGISR